MQQNSRLKHQARQVNLTSVTCRQVNLTSVTGGVKGWIEQGAVWVFGLDVSR